MADNVLFAPVRVLSTTVTNGAGYKVRFYDSGTTTPKTVYTASDLLTAHPVPLVADATGTFPAVFSSSGAVKAVITTAADAAYATVDPCFLSPSSSSGAASITFNPTAEITADDVQAAIEEVQANIGDELMAYGIGTTGDAPLRAALDATGAEAGGFRFNASTTGTFPAGVVAADTGIGWEQRQSASVAWQVLRSGTVRNFIRRMSALSWAAWREFVTVEQGAARGAIARFGASAWEKLDLGSARKTFRSDGTDAVWEDDLASGTVITTTGGTAVEFAVPTNVKEIILTVNGASLSGTDHFLVQLSTSAAYVTTGYSNGAGGGAYTSRSGSGTSSTSGFPIFGNGAAVFATGEIRLVKHTGNTWLCTHLVTGGTGTDDVARGTGSIALAGAVDGIRLTRSGSNTFDAMSLNAHWR